MPGQYTYTVKETGDISGVENDPAAKDGKVVYVTVIDNKEGKLEATVTEYSEENPVTFTNTYSAEPAGASFPVEKTMVVPQGLTGPESWSYTIGVTAEDGSPAADEMAKEINNDTPATSFGPFTFTMPGQYTYTVKETGDISGVENDPAAEDGKVVYVTVIDNKEGKLEATVTEYSEENPVTFTNTYSVEPTEANFPVKKILSVPENLEGPATWTYDITVEAMDGAPAAETMTGSVDNTADTATFGPFSYTVPGTYTYTVTETGTIAGVTNDGEATSGKTVTVEVKDAKDGTLTYTVTSTNENPLTFTNTYSVEELKLDTSVKFSTKTVVSKTAFPAKTFDFTMTEVADEKGTALEDAVLVYGTLNFTEAGVKNIDFGKITYKEPGTHYYKVIETTTAEFGDGWQMDAEALTGKIVTVVITDNREGKLVADVTDVNFTNEYVGEPAIEIIKTTTSTPANGTAYVLGEEITYDLTVTNTGNVTLHDIVVDDPLTGGHWTISKLDAGVTLEVFTTSYIVKEADTLAGKVTNKATVTAKDPNEDPVEDDDEVEDPTEAGITLTVVKVWADGNRVGGRPASLIVTLTGGGQARFITLTAANNWTASVPNLPKTDPNGRVITYTWSEPAIAGYTQTSIVTNGNTTTITNTRNNVPPRNPIIEEEETPLGLGIVYINVGDCLE